MDSLPVFDLSSFLETSTLQANPPLTTTLLETSTELPPSTSDSTPESHAEEQPVASQDHLGDTCKQMASCLRDAGAIIIRDPRCSEGDNERFLDMMERYFDRPHEAKLQEARPELHYQVGSTPEGVEVPKCVQDNRMRGEMEAMPAGSRPKMPSGADCKWRYMWRVGRRPQHTSFPELNASPVVPPGFKEWGQVMDGWGHKMIAAVETVSEMLALGLGLEQQAFSDLMREGPHLLAPTGSDLGRHGTPGAVLAGYHSDLNFLTIHGRCRFPGLFIWLRNGRKVPVFVPAGCLLLQAGKQMEWLTGGAIKAGMHEVVVSPMTIDAIERARQEGRSLWRVSSTVFGHIASDRLLQPLGHFATTPESSAYPPTLTGAFVESELAMIKLKPTTGDVSAARDTSVAGDSSAAIDKSIAGDKSVAGAKSSAGENSVAGDKSSAGDFLTAGDQSVAGGDSTAGGIVGALTASAGEAVDVGA